MNENSDSKSVIRRIENLKESSSAADVSAVCAESIQAMRLLGSHLVRALAKVDQANRQIIVEHLSTTGVLSHHDAAQMFESAHDGDLKFMLALLLAPSRRPEIEDWLLRSAREVPLNIGNAVAALRALSMYSHPSAAESALAILLDHNNSTLHWSDVTALLGVVEKRGDPIPANVLETLRLRHPGSIVGSALDRLRVL